MEKYEILRIWGQNIIAPLVDDNGTPKSATHSFYKKKGMSKGYKDSYPISNEEYNKHILNGAPFTCPKCDKPCKRQLSFDYHLASKCMGIKMIWPKWEKVQKDKFMCLLPDCPEAGKILGKFERDYFVQLFKTDKSWIKQWFLHVL